MLEWLLKWQINTQSLRSGHEQWSLVKQFPHLWSVDWFVAWLCGDLANLAVNGFRVNQQNTQKLSWEKLLTPVGCYSLAVANLTERNYETEVGNGANGDLKLMRRQMERRWTPLPAPLPTPSVIKTRRNVDSLTTNNYQVLLMCNFSWSYFFQIVFVIHLILLSEYLFFFSLCSELYSVISLIIHNCILKRWWIMNWHNEDCHLIYGINLCQHNVCP